jgi:hypothetical protein
MNTPILIGIIAQGAAVLTILFFTIKNFNHIKKQF